MAGQSAHTRGCTMCHSLYVKANGEMPCWDDVGEALTLRTLSEAALRDNREPPIFQGPELRHIRESFLDGTNPHPGFCERCAVRGHSGQEVVSAPLSMEVLHLEASYLCHLSCPQCIPARQRHSLKEPPYHMTTGLLDGLLVQLRREGVSHIRFIHFEGRGDPLANPWLKNLIEIAKRHFPKALVGATTHCSYPYMPWIVTSKLDLLRASIDGASPESYARYRVGGNFERVVDFLKKLRDDRMRVKSTLRVEWKYILFEWNDTDSEMQRAAELAKELHVHLTFVRTHTPGRSKRFETDEDLDRHLRRFAPQSAVELTFQVRSARPATPTTAVIAEHVASLLSSAVECVGRGDPLNAATLLSEALKHDPGIAVCEDSTLVEIIDRYLPEILSGCQFASTLTWMAELSRQTGKPETAEKCLARYLEVVPDASDRNHVLSDHFTQAAARCAGNHQLEAAYDALRQAMYFEFGIPVSPAREDPIAVHLQRLLHTTCSASLVAAFANVAVAQKDDSAAHALFTRYLELSPAAYNRDEVISILADLDNHIRASRIQTTVVADRSENWFGRLRRMIS